MKGIHPFPARMAPEIALAQISRLPGSATLLDPMCGSGTVMRAGVEHGCSVVGFDVDPLAVLMARVWCTPPTKVQFMHDVHQLLELAEASKATTVEDLAWIDDETHAFINFWFGDAQRPALVRLASALQEANLPSKDALRLALSRIIVTKERGASLGRDISHSRPHKVAAESDYDVEVGFLKSARLLSARLAAEEVRGQSEVRLGDSRMLNQVVSGSIDCVITSPPYLNAIDYLRGHRLSLVWLGYSLAELRAIRGNSIGVERALRSTTYDPRAYVTPIADAEAPAKLIGWTTRYLKDARAVASEIARVLKPGGEAVLVVGNSNLRGFKVDNARMYLDALTDAGLSVLATDEREIPTRSRYLPTSTGSALASRMRMESVLRVQQSATTSA